MRDYEGCLGVEYDTLRTILNLILPPTPSENHTMYFYMSEIILVEKCVKMSMAISAGYGGLWVPMW